MTFKSSAKLTPSPWDALVVLVIVAAGLLLSLALLRQQSAATGDHLTVTISQDGEVLDTVDLSTLPEDHREITVTGAYTAVVELERERVCIASSDCPTQDCVHTGWISKPGQSIVCLPNHLVVELSGDGGAIDAVLG